MNEACVRTKKAVWIGRSFMAIFAGMTSKSGGHETEYRGRCSDKKHWNTWFGVKLHLG